MNVKKTNDINSVLLVGGTHGNELTGIKLVEQWRHSQSVSNHEKKRQATCSGENGETRQFPPENTSYKLDFLIANPDAIRSNKRYVDHDLNRCFKQNDLNNSQLNSLEQKRAKQINAEYGPKGDSKTDFIIDLHTSTANMQTNIVITRVDEFHLQLAHYLKKTLKDVVVTSETDLMSDHYFLESIATKGIVIEIGPIPQGCIEYPCFETTQNAVMASLNFVEQWNSGLLEKSKGTIELMSYHSRLYFPTDQTNNICASVHPDLIGKAYPKIKPGDPLFKYFDGRETIYQSEMTYAAFINEAAYYDQNIALCLCRPIVFCLETYCDIGPRT